MSGHTQLRDLIDLAKEPSSERRRELLRNVTELFLEQPADHNALERGHFSDIMGQVAKSMEVEVRSELAHRLAGVAEAPRDLINQLAHDEIDVATPILEGNTSLTEEDLLQIIQKKGNAHRTIVAARPDVNETISDALVDHGNDQVIHTLVCNENAKIAQQTISKVVDRASHNEALHSPLLDRKDLPADVMHNLYWVVSGKLRTRILEKSADLDPEIVDRVLADSERKLLKNLAKNDQERTRAQQFIDRKVALRELSETLLVDLVRANRLDELVCGFAKMVKIDEATAERILYDESGEALAIACKAIRFDRVTFSTLALLSPAQTKRELKDTRELLAVYEDMPQELALRAMRFWRVRRDTISEAA
jgi:uncharacterized protein (DUF2336 family)